MVQVRVARACEPLRATSCADGVGTRRYFFITRWHFFSNCQQQPKKAFHSSELP